MTLHQPRCLPDVVMRSSLSEGGLPQNIKCPLSKSWPSKKRRSKMLRSRTLDSFDDSRESVQLPPLDLEDTDVEATEEGNCSQQVVALSVHRLVKIGAHCPISAKEKLAARKRAIQLKFKHAQNGRPTVTVVGAVGVPQRRNNIGGEHEIPEELRMTLFAHPPTVFEEEQAVRKSQALFPSSRNSNNVSGSFKLDDPSETHCDPDSTAALNEIDGLLVANALSRMYSSDHRDPDLDEQPQQGEDSPVWAKKHRRFAVCSRSSESEENWDAYRRAESGTPTCLSKFREASFMTGSFDLDASFRTWRGSEVRLERSRSL
jgi:hypothetical protein